MATETAASSSACADEPVPVADEAAGEGHVDGASALPQLVDGWPKFPTVIERYFTTHTTSNHQSLHVHSNGCAQARRRRASSTHHGFDPPPPCPPRRVCVLAVAPSHPMLQSPSQVASIAYRTGDAKDLSQTAVKGKKKAGGVFVNPRDLVATVTLSDGEEITLYACVRAYVVEINPRLVQNPSLLGTPGGYVAVLLPKLVEKKSIGEACLEFDREAPLAQQSSTSKRKQEGKSVRTNNNKKRKREKGVCFAFQAGRCKWGEKCRFSHDPPDADASETPAAAEGASAAGAEGASATGAEGASAAGAEGASAE
jgi:hypothetical protein